MLRAVALALLLGLVGVQAVALARGSGTGVIVTPGATSVPLRAAAEGSPLEPDFLAHMTADDVARGVYGLAAVEGVLALSSAQRGSIGPFVGEGAALRARLGELRMARRAAREAWLVDGTELSAGLGRARVAVLVRR